MRYLLTIVVLFCSVASASAQNCSATVVLTPKAHFADVGAYTTKGPAALTNANCSFEKFNLEGVAITPFRAGDTGEEYDVKMSWQTSYDKLGVRAFLAWYHYDIGSTKWLDDLDFRLTVDYKIELGSMLTISPYVSGGHKWLLTSSNQNDYLIGGVVGALKLTDKVSFNLGLGNRHEFSPGLNMRPNVQFLETGFSLNVSEQNIIGINFTLSKGGAGDDLREGVSLFYTHKF